MNDYTLDVLAWSMVFSAAALTAGLFMAIAGFLMLAFGLAIEYTQVYTVMVGVLVYLVFWAWVLTLRLTSRMDRVEP